MNIEALGHNWTSTATTLAMEMRQRRTFLLVLSKEPKSQQPTAGLWAR